MGSICSRCGEYHDELREKLDKIAEREAACCPEDVPFDEYIRSLKTYCETIPPLQRECTELREKLEAAERHVKEARRILAHFADDKWAMAFLAATAPQPEEPGT